MNKIFFKKTLLFIFFQLFFIVQQYSISSQRFILSKRNNKKYRSRTLCRLEKFFAS